MKDWILVIDNDPADLQIARDILTAEGMRVNCLESAEGVLQFLQNNKPDLILLDIHMPGMDSFEILSAIKNNEDTSHIPVIILIANDDSGMLQSHGLKSGAMDFLRKPFVSEVLLNRVRHTITLVRLQADLAREVSIRTKEATAQHEKMERISMQIVKALSEAIDAKDTYTIGHSTRVAEYSRAIAKRAGFSENEQDDIYMMGLLHDVGKIGVSDNIINKPAQLTKDEYDIMKTHPVTGDMILESISEFPTLYVGAKWHHERFDGTGYPDGLAGEQIPKEARIISVADAYDAMSSKRSYRSDLPQAHVRSELQKGMGTQFDPVYAQIMIDMIDEDKDYQMREA